MGCDIHVFAEHKWRHDGSWDFIHEVECYRNYHLFGALAGVRRSKILFPVRGIPADLSAPVAREWEDWIGDGHTPSWLTPTEIISADWSAIEGGGSPMLEYARYLEVAVYGEKRIVFWFDN